MMPFAMGAGDQVEEQQKAALYEFEGFVECALFSEECKINIEKDGISIASMFQQLPLRYGEISALEWKNNQVVLQTAAGKVTLSRMGQEAQWLYEKLYAAYNDAVLKALYVSGNVLLEASGEYAADEEGISHQGEAIIRLYEDCLCILPPNENARRLPLCFFAKAQQSGYAYEITLATGERYVLSKLGYGLDELDRNLRSLFYQLREKTSSWQKELAPGMGSLQAASAAGLMPLGRAADYKKLKETAPPLAVALEEKLKKSRIAATWPWLAELCSGEGLMIGAMPAPEKDAAGVDMGALLGNLNPTGIMNTGQPQTLPDVAEAGQEEGMTEPLPILWLIAPDEEKRLAAVELALADNEAAATYLYRVQGDWQTFAGKIDRALEACAFHREAILLPEEKLILPEYMEDAMLIRRTPVLGALRRAFAGRAIHTSFGRWKRDIEKCREAFSLTETPVKETICAACGAALSADTKFCGQCGTRNS